MEPEEISEQPFSLKEVMLRIELTPVGVRDAVKIEQGITDFARMVA